MKVHLSFVLQPDIATDSYSSWLKIFHRFYNNPLWSNDFNAKLNIIKQDNCPGFFIVMPSNILGGYTKGFEDYSTMQMLLKNDCNMVAPGYMQKKLNLILELANV